MPRLIRIVIEMFAHLKHSLGRLDVIKIPELAHALLLVSKTRKLNNTKKVKINRDLLKKPLTLELNWTLCEVSCLADSDIESAQSMRGVHMQK